MTVGTPLTRVRYPPVPRESGRGDSLVPSLGAAKAAAADDVIAGYTALYGGPDVKTRLSAQTAPYARLKKFGPAFSTKFLYFTTSGALILDNVLAGAVHDLTQMPYLIRRSGHDHALETACADHLPRAVVGESPLPIPPVYIARASGGIIARTGPLTGHAPWKTCPPSAGHPVRFGVQEWRRASGGKRSGTGLRRAP
jgi:hypothetical protein